MQTKAEQDQANRERLQRYLNKLDAHHLSRAKVAAHIHQAAGKQGLDRLQKATAVRFAMSFIDQNCREDTALKIGLDAIKTISTHHASFVKPSPH